MQTALRYIPDGVAGTDCTVKAIQRLVESSLRSQSLRLRALEILRGFRVDSHAPTETARALFHWVQTNIRYVYDPVGLETVQSPEVTLRIKAGDCDDHAGLMAALAMSVGVNARLVVIGPSADNFQHIYAELMTDGTWQPADTTRPVGYGSPAPELGVKKIYEFTESVGLGSMKGYEEITKTVDAAELQAAVKNETLSVIVDGWNAGKINRADVVAALSEIDGGRAPFEHDLWLKNVIRESIVFFLDDIDKNGVVSSKPLAGLSGFFSFLTPVWNGVKSVVQWLFSGKTYQGNTVVLPSVQQPQPTFTQSVSSFFAENTGLVLVGGGLLAYLLLRKN